MKLASPAVVAATLAASGIALAVPAMATPAAGASHTKVISSCTKTTYRPQSYVLTCADANTSITKATYSSWTARSAEGSGTYRYNTCTPDCASGTFKKHPVTFILSRPKTVHGKRLFTRMDVTYAGLTETFSLPTSTE